MTGDLDLMSGEVTVDDGVATVRVVGELDLATMSAFSALTDQAVTLGLPHVVVDLLEVAFLDCQPLHVLVSAAERLRQAGARLSVVGVSPQQYRIFEMTALTTRLAVAHPDPDAALLWGMSRAVDGQRVRRVLDASLQLVVVMAQAVVKGADGASITLPRAGRFGTVAASNDVVLEMDHDQYDTGQGPCLDAATQGERFHIVSLRDEDRWPSFVPRARSRGIESILSTPLLAGARPIGALNVYSRAVGAFAAHEKAWTDQFATEAAVVLASAEVGAPADAFRAQLQDGLLSREVIAMAQGLVMQRDGLSAEAAYALLRSASRRSSQPLRELCAELLAAAGGGHGSSGK